MYSGKLARTGPALYLLCLLYSVSTCLGLWTEDTAELSPYQEDIYYLRYENEAKPDHCRNDLCPEYYTHSTRKGRIEWPTIGVGFRRRMPCPYAPLGDVYAENECIFVNSTGGVLRPAWNESGHENCPEPPLSELLKGIMADVLAHTTEAQSWQPDKPWYEHSLIEPLDDMIFLMPMDVMQDWFSGRVREIMQNIVSYPNEEIYPDNFRHVLAVCYGGVTMATPESVTRDSLRDTMDCFEWLFLTGFSSMDDRHRMVWALTTIVDLVPTPNVDDLEFRGQVYSLVSSSVDSATNYVNDSFVAKIDGKMKVQLSVETNNEKNATWRFLYIGKRALWTEGQIELLPERVRAIPTETLPESLDREDRPILLLPPDNHSLHTEGNFTPIFAVPIKIEPPIRYVEIPRMFWDLSHRNPESIGPMLYVSDGENALTQPLVHFSVALDSLGEFEYIKDEAVQCGMWYKPPPVSIEDYPSMTLEMCEDTELKYTDTELTHVECRCSGVGYFGVFAILEFSHPIIRPSENFIADEEHGLDVFLGFPYISELRVTSHVLRAISLVLLIVTLFSFIAFKKTHRGRPTRILIQLCVSLIGLVVVLYISEAIASTRRGCQVSNILRYYFILVSLLWNAVEALNMYLMLVKVFNITVSHFVAKCAVVAWGAPAILVAIILAIYSRNFDGLFTKACKFRCRLRPTVLTYGLFLPMGLIFLHNIIVLGLVIKEIYRKDKPIVSKRSHWTTLCGIISLMVLLGLPWIFSAFGAIDSDDKHSTVALLEGVFHAVFLISINLQGLFIFLFHCMRNADMRAGWKGTFTRSLQSTPSQTRSMDAITKPPAAVRLKDTSVSSRDTIRDTADACASIDSV